MDLYNRYCNLGDAERNVNAYITCATIGKAAVALCDFIIPSAFKLNGPNTDRYRGLSSSNLTTFRNAFRNIRCIVIGTVSMMSGGLLVLIYQGLRNISQMLLEPFGGFDVMLCGDLRQLPPVRATEMYKRSTLFNTFFNVQRMPRQSVFLLSSARSKAE
ncbi:hypothetical protein HPB49_010174 [Dermacentor silvarum]|uniref:Uncharacterized protein n=1 Tax=Dermacentor silvarum TaxID=543639 RepID=A0ACB8C2X6_DERSI|nr:hypothetical protein HPB49_010174 [Dermacentor silvarum]